MVSLAKSAQTRQHRGKGVWTDQITGSFTKISVHQLVMAWWCFQAKHITKRQLRLYFAAHEMSTRRRFSRDQEPLYRLDEVKALVGGRGSKSADAELRADIIRLRKIGLVAIGKHKIAFATSIEQLKVDEIQSFWTMLGEVRNNRRSVPVPRRMIRALAAGYSRGVTAVVICTLIRSLYWHKAEQGYRIDGRVKREWIAQVFGVSLRTVTDARRQLIDIGWIKPIDDPQWLLNRYGAHDLINIEWFSPPPTSPPTHTQTPSSLNLDTPALQHQDAQPGESSRGGDSDDRRVGGGKPASPRGDFRGKSASPDLTDFSSSNEEEIKTRRPTRRRSASSRADQPGVSLRSTLGSRKKNKRVDRTIESGGGSAAGRGGRKNRSRKIARSGGATGVGGPNIRDIQARDLSDTGRLLELYRQAVELGIAKNGEGGRLDFVALAERARTRGENPPAFFFACLRDNRTKFITQAQEDEAAQRIKTHLYGDPRKREQWGGGEVCTPPNQVKYTDDEKIVAACIKVAKQRRIDDPFIVARTAKQWTRAQWNNAYLSYQTTQVHKWKQLAETPAGGELGPV